MKSLKVILLPVLFLQAYALLSGSCLGQAKKYILKQEKAGELKTMAINNALSMEGVTENPNGSNKGKEVNKFLQSVNLSPGNQWCVAFCQWAYRSAAKQISVNFNLVKSGHSLTVLAYAKKQGFFILNNLKRGDLVIFQRGETNKGHCGMLLSSVDNKLYTIEGNVTADDKTQGVFKKIRRLDNFGWLHIIGFIGFEESH